MDALTFKPHVQSLVEKTQKFWLISRVYNGQSDVTMTTETALKALSKVVNDCNPARPVYQQAGELQYHIITGGAKNAKAV